MFKQLLRNQRKEHGQSLVEVALFLPIFIIILAGLVEVSNLVVTQNRVSNAARVGARFAANGGDDAGMDIAVLNSITQTLNTDEDRWDVWAIRGAIAADGNSFDEWSFTHVYGISNTVQSATLDESAIQSQVLGELQKDQTGATSIANAGDLRIAGAYVIHDVDSILGLDAIPALAQVNSISDMNVMRITGVKLEPTNGCDAFPIAVHEAIRSVTPVGQGSNPFPAPGDFSNQSPTPLPNYTDFLNHVPDVPLADAKEGYIYKVQNGFGSGNFGWLVWNTLISPSAATLADSLAWPGDSANYTPLPGGKFAGYQEPGDPTDRELNVGDWVAGSTGSINSNGARNVLNGHITADRQLRLIVWDTTNGQTGVNGWYKVAGFAIFRLHGYSLDQSQGSWILAEFIRWDDSCGQTLP